MTLTSPAAIEAALARETAQVFIALLDLDHSTWIDTLRFANNTETVVSGGNTYAPFPFKLVRPAETDDVPEATLTVANVDQVIGARLDAVSTPIDVAITIVLAESPDTVERSWPGFELRNVKWNALFAEGVLTQRQFSRELWPPRRMTPTHGFPWMLKRK